MVYISVQTIIASKANQALAVRQRNHKITSCSIQVKIEVLFILSWITAQCYGQGQELRVEEPLMTQMNKKNRHGTINHYLLCAVSKKLSEPSK